MPRICVLCGRPQSRSFSVFSFPSSKQQRAEWIKAIIEVKRDLIKDKIISQEYKLKNGVCELHFLRSEISNGKKKRLCREAVPSINITPSQKCNLAFKSYKRILNSDLPMSEDKSSKNKCEDMEMHPHRPSSPECTIELRDDDEDKNSNALKIINSLINDGLHGINKGMCLCCGSVEHVTCLKSCLKFKFMHRECLVIEDLCSIFQIPKEEIIMHSKLICRKCFRILEDIMELKRCLQSMVSVLKQNYISTIEKFKEKSRADVCLEINENKNCKTNIREDIFSSTDLKLKTNANIHDYQDKRKFFCEQCSQEFSGLDDLCNHNRSHISNNGGSIKENIKKPNYTCQNCSKTFSTKIALATHMKSHQQNFDCPQCGRYITSKARLKFHLYKIHGLGKEKDKSFKCHLCDKCFTSKAGLRYHSYSAHKAGKLYSCEICDKIFSYRALYASHKLYAHGKKNFVCEMCGEMFFTTSKLNIHINAVHHKVLSWLCKICNEKFPTAATYKHHVSSKHKRVFYSCSYCESRFSKKISLMQHLWKHGVYECLKCNNKFTESALFTEHMLQIHKVDVSLKINKFCSSQRNEDQHSVVSNSEPKLPSSNKKEPESDIVINDILITSNNFDNNNLPSLSYNTENNNKSQDKPSFDDLSNVDAIHFDNVDSLEIQQVPNEPMELEEDVSLINVQMLEGIPVPEHSNSMKDEILSTDKHGKITLADTLQTNDTSPTLRNVSSNVQAPLSTDNSKSDNQLKDLAMMDSLPSSTLPDSSKPTNNHALSIVEPLVPSHLESSDLVNLPVILQPVKNNDWASFSNSLGEHSESSVDPVIHSLEVQGEIPDGDPPITREIDITIPSEDEESKLPPLNNTMNVDKIENEDISTLSVDIDGKGDVHYKYVMYFDPALEKN